MCEAIAYRNYNCIPNALIIIQREKLQYTKVKVSSSPVKSTSFIIPINFYFLVNYERHCGLQFKQKELKKVKIRNLFEEMCLSKLTSKYIMVSGKLFQNLLIQEHKYILNVLVRPAEL